ncbi:MAG: pyruvate dehydrogenase complex dihydrolipoamide acetyltransferase [Rhodospirillales bacterium]|nr:pyruvate dehydrogenase complex dihydrolipoamide acetyltransferase [Rhodospirillales bacterium]
MPVQILMPALSPTMTEGKLAKWVKKEGDAVDSGDVLAEIETDKATMEIEAVEEGILGKILVAEGTENVAVNAVIALLLEDGEDASALEGASAPAPVAAPAVEGPSAAAPQPAPQAAPAPARDGTRTIASPLARRIAADKGIDLATISGSGPRGRIVKSDVESAMPGAPAAASSFTPSPPSAPGAPLSPMPEFEAVPHSPMRKAIARRLTESARDIPHFNVSVDVHLDALLDTRKRLNNHDGAVQKISVNDFVIKAVALALARVPACNVSFTEDATIFHKRADISVAVSIEGGLITPIVKDAGNKGLATIAQEAKSLAERARAGDLKPDEYEGGTFTISNMGMMGVTSFNSIINPPQGAILSVGAGALRPVVTNGALSTATVMTLTLAVDHRCIDGVVAAEFIGQLKSILEEPLQFML